MNYLDCIASAVVLIESDWNLKMLNHNHTFFECEVLIESDWNLKFIICIRLKNWNSVLIESDWNLKLKKGKLLCVRKAVLIESDWNLKSMTADPTRRFAACINRIRLELKLFLESDALCSCFSWRVAHHWSGGYDCLKNTEKGC